MIKLLDKATGRCDGIRFPLQNNCHSLVYKVVQGPEIGCPVGVRESTLEREETRHDLREMIVKRTKG